MPQKNKNKDTVIYQMKVTLNEIKPPIWRRIQVRSDTTLSKLHRIIQEIMGWYDCHLHQFIICGMPYSTPLEDDFFDAEDERKVKLNQVVSEEGEKFVYEYDFGDSWEHIIKVEKILPLEAGKHYPVCLKGKRACPPEDCGGVYGYYDFLEAVQDPEHPDHEEMLDWVGEGEFDPEAFNLDDLNKKLGSIK